MKNSMRECPNCGRKISCDNTTCPWCHTELPADWHRDWKDNKKYGIAALVLSFLITIVGFVLGGLAMSRNTGYNRTLGKVAIAVSCVNLLGRIVLAAMVIEILYGIHY